MQKRLVLLVPTDKDMEDPEHLAKYWPNFVCRVKDALARDGLSCEIRVVARDTQSTVGDDWQIVRRG